MSLGQKTFIGTAWSLAEQFSVHGINFIVTLLLALILTPEDFGYLAMILVFINIASSLMDSGLRQALIRITDAKPADFDTVFVANLTLSVLAYLILYVSAPSIAGFYGKAFLTELIRVLGVVVVLNCFQVVQYAHLSRAMNFKLQFRVALLASMLSVFPALTVAYIGLGVWALVSQILMASLFRAVLLWWKGGWRPTGRFSIESLKSMYVYGYKLFLADLLEIIFRNIFVVVIAKLFSVSVAGLYFLAEKIADLVILRVTTSIQNVSFPALAKIQEQHDQLKASYKSLLIANTYVLCPFILLTAVISEPFFNAFLPEKWGPASSYLSLMCLAGIMTPMSALNLNLLKVLGRSDLSLKIEIIKKTVQVSILSISISFGVIGVLYGQIVGSIIIYFINSHYARQLIDYSALEQLADFTPNFLLAIGVAMVVYLLQVCCLNEINALINFLIVGVAGILLFITLSIFFQVKGYYLLKRYANQVLFK